MALTIAPVQHATCSTEGISATEKASCRATRQERIKLHTHKKKALLFSSSKRAVVRDQCEKPSIEVRLIETSGETDCWPPRHGTQPHPGGSSFTSSEEQPAQKTSWLQAAPSLFFHPDSSASLLSPPQTLLQREAEGSPRPRTPTVLTRTPYQGSVSCLQNQL